MYDLTRFGKRLKEERQKKALTQRKLSQLSGVNVSTLRKYENEGMYPSAFNAICLADVLHVTVNYLLGEDYLI